MKMCWACTVYMCTHLISNMKHFPRRSSERNIMSERESHHIHRRPALSSPNVYKFGLTERDPETEELVLVSQPPSDRWLRLGSWLPCKRLEATLQPHGANVEVRVNCGLRG